VRLLEHLPLLNRQVSHGTFATMGKVRRTWSHSLAKLTEVHSLVVIVVDDVHNEALEVLHIVANIKLCESIVDLLSVEDSSAVGVKMSEGIRQVEVFVAE
jgi:hypothetical protein